MDNNKYRKTAIFLLIFFFIAILILKEPYVGIADNSDYYRVMQPLGFEPEIGNRYYYAYNFYTVNDMSQNDIKGSLSNIINPKVENNNEYFSTQFIFIKASMIINYIIKIILGKSPEIFNMKVLGLFYAVVYAYGLYLFLTNIKIKSRLLNIFFVLLSIVMLCDMGYIIYFNSFFGEAPILASLMAAAGSYISFINSDTKMKSVFTGIIFFVSCIMFVGAKVANTPIGILIGLFSLSLLKIKKDKINRIVIMSGSVIIICFSIFYYLNAPDWMNQVNNYQSIFYGITKDSPDPKSDLDKLNIPLKYLSLTNTHGFLDHGGIDIYSHEFQKEVYDKSSFVNVTKFYLTNPQRLIQKLVISADNSVIIRPSYLGNYSKDYMNERLSFTERFSLWSNVRKQTLGYAFYIIAVYSAVYFVINIIELINNYKQKMQRETIFSYAGLLLFLTAMSQFVLPIIGNGEADLQKHMLLFNICFDLMLLTGIHWLIQNYNHKTILKITAASAAVLVVVLLIVPINHKEEYPADAVLKRGQHVFLGNYKEKPLKWIVLAYSKDGYLLWNEDAVEYMEFDLIDENNADNHYGSNNWQQSDIRKWLNEDFKNSFTEEEQKLINEVELKNALSYNDIGYKAGGNKPYYWTAITSYVDQNYNRDAYYNYSKDEIFLLDTYQLKKFVYDNNIELKKNERYWLRTPYYSNLSMIRIVDKDGFVYHKDAAVKAGVIPAMYLNDRVYIDSGKGTRNSPFELGYSKDGGYNK